MEINTFWDLVDASRLASGDPSERADWLVMQLASGPAADVVDFHVHRLRLSARAYDWRLWGAAHQIMRGCSDDGFARFRAWTIGLGREWFERVIADPDRLADHPEIRAGGCPEWEDLLYVARRAHAAATGGEGPTVREFSLAPSGERWDFGDPEEAARRLPRIGQLFSQVSTL
jgi:hypothetical protein